jgi:hypothetical protein
MVPTIHAVHLARAASGDRVVADAALALGPVQDRAIEVVRAQVQVTEAAPEIVRHLVAKVVAVTGLLVMVEMIGRPNSWETISLIAE